MKIYYFAHTQTAATASTRYRGTYLLQEIKRRYGIDYRIYYPTMPSFFQIFFLNLRLFIKYDDQNIYVIQKLSGYGKYFRLLSFIIKHVKKSIYDIDDAMYAVRSKAAVDFLISHCRGVTAASRNLKEYSLKLNENAVLLTTAVPLPAAVKWARNRTLTVGWIGVYKTVHKESLENIFFPLLAKIDFKIELLLLGIQNNEQGNIVRDIFKKYRNVSLVIVRDINWNNEAEINHHLLRFDVGIMPLVDNEINRSKSSFKIKQYLSCGIPTLASDVGDNALFVKNGETGFLCRTEEDWLKYIAHFSNISDGEYRKFAKKSHRYFLDGNFNTTRSAELFFDYISRL